MLFLALFDGLHLEAAGGKGGFQLADIGA